jgi:hypothetical protein
MLLGNNGFGLLRDTGFACIGIGLVRFDKLTH